MIPGDFYTPPAWTDANVNAAPTALIKDIPITTPEFTQAYWLGWRAWENVPQQYHISRIDNGTFTDVTKTENVPVGFLVSDASYYSPSLHRAILLANNGEKWNKLRWPAYTESSTNNARLPNALNVNTVVWNNLRLGFIGMATINNTEQFISGFALISQNDLFNPGTISVNLGDTIGTQQINLADFTDGQFAEYTSSGGYPYKIVLAFYTIEYNRDVTIYDGWYGYQGIHPMMQIRDIDDKPHIEAIALPMHYDGELNFNWGNGRTGQGFFMNFNGGIEINCPSNEGGDIFGGFVGTIDFDEVVPNIYGVFIYGNFYCRCIGRNDLFIVGRIYTIGEIIKSITLLPRFRDAAGNAYTNTGFLYSKVNLETNEFLPEFVSGNTPNLLTDWQKLNGNINTNEVTTDDIPEYVPPTPSDAENIGDKITRPATLGIGGTNGFVTLYALRKSDIAQLGELLWTSFIDADYWKNYLFSLALDTGTFSLAGLLNFFVSCRVYPFPLINIAGCTSFGKNMYVGTGTVPLEFNAQTTLHVLTDMVDYISGGYCNVPRYFNDWRDYVNTEIMLYIPYCGTVRLNPGDVIGNKISVQYAVDFATGGCIAYVDMETGDGAGYPVGAIPGQIGADIPLTATAAGEVAARFIGDALNVGGIVAGEGASVASGALGAAMGKPSAGGSGNVLSGAAGMLGGLPAAMAVDMAVPLAKQGLSMLARGAVQAPMLSGGRGFASFGAPQKPYVQIRRGIYPEITGLLDIAGKPAATTTTIGALSGFVQGDVKTDGLPCHENEKAKIRRLIADGIYV